MKKFLVILLAVALLMMSAAFAEAADITGEWYGLLYGMAVTIDVKADGTYSVILGGEEANTGSWEVEGDTFYMDRGEAETLWLIGEGTLTNEEQGITLGREPVEGIQLPAAIVASDISDFDGTWTLSAVEAYGMTIDAATAQAELGGVLNMEEDTIVIEAGVANVFATEQQTFEFTDGKLYIPSPSEEDPDFAQSIVLCDDGSICYTLLGMNLYFAK